MTRDGSGKLKGRRNRRATRAKQRPAGPMRWIDRHIDDWRYYTRLVAIDETPRSISWAEIQDAMKW